MTCQIKSTTQEHFSTHIRKSPVDLTFGLDLEVTQQPIQGVLYQNFKFWLSGFTQCYGSCILHHLNFLNNLKGISCIT